MQRPLCLLGGLCLCSLTPKPSPTPHYHRARRQGVKPPPPAQRASGKLGTGSRIHSRLCSVPHGPGVKGGRKWGPGPRCSARTLKASSPWKEGRGLESEGTVWRCPCHLRWRHDALLAGVLQTSALGPVARAQPAVLEATDNLRDSTRGTQEVPGVTSEWRRAGC